MIFKVEAGEKIRRTHETCALDIQSIERKYGDNLDSSGTPSKELKRANHKISEEKRYLLKSKKILRASPQ